MISSARACSVASSVGLSLARTYGLLSCFSLVAISSPFQPVRSWPLNSGTKPGGGLVAAPGEEWELHAEHVMSSSARRGKCFMRGSFGRENRKDTERGQE